MAVGFILVCRSRVTVFLLNKFLADDNKLIFVGFAFGLFNALIR